MAAARSALRAVGEDETAKPKTIEQAAAVGDELAMLLATRARIAKTLDSPKCPPRDLAALSRRLVDINQEIKALEAQEGGDDLSEAANTPDASFDPQAL